MDRSFKFLAMLSSPTANGKRFICLSAFCLFSIATVLIVLNTCTFLRSCQSSGPSLNYLDPVRRRNTIQLPASFEKQGIYGFSKVLSSPKEFPRNLLFLIIIASSSLNPKGEARRDVIRRTWGNCHGKQLQSRLVGSELIKSSIAKDRKEDFVNFNHCKVIFNIGAARNTEFEKRIQQESAKHGDMIVSDVSENYKNMTLKLRTVFSYVSSTDAKFIVKADDDVYINLPRLAMFLANDADVPYTLYGGFPYSGTVVRDKKHRHFVLREDFSETYYPRFCKGSMVVLSGHIVAPLVKAFTHIKPFSIDDAYMGITLNRIGVAPVRINKFVQFQHLPVMLDFLHLCDFSWLIGVGDSLTPPQMIKIHNAMISSDNLPSWMCWHFNIYGHMLFIIVLVLLYIFLSKMLNFDDIQRKCKS